MKEGPVPALMCNHCEHKKLNLVTKKYPSGRQYGPIESYWVCGKNGNKSIARHTFPIGIIITPKWCPFLTDKSKENDKA